MYKKSVINMATKLYDNLPKFIQEIDDYKAFKKEVTHCGRVTQICVFNTVKLDTSASSP